MQEAYPDWMPVGDPYRPRVLRNRQAWHAACKRCGKTGLKWKAEVEGWRLYENQRGDRNQLLKHECNKANDDDFECIDA